MGVVVHMNHGKNVWIATSLRRNASPCESHMPAMASCHLVAFAAWHHLIRREVGPKVKQPRGLKQQKEGISTKN
jgi:hypothetical protein